MISKYTLFEVTTGNKNIFVNTINYLVLLQYNYVTP
jgi:hypothetical protein